MEVSTVMFSILPAALFCMYNFPCANHFCGPVRSKQHPPLFFPGRIILHYNLLFSAYLKYLPIIESFYIPSACSLLCENILKMVFYTAYQSAKRREMSVHIRLIPCEQLGELESSH